MTNPLPQPSGPFRWVQALGARPIPAPALVCEPLAGLADHFFTTRAWTLGRTKADEAAAWGEVADALGLAPERLRRARQVHGAAAIVAGANGGPLPEADILVSDRHDVAVAVQAADCVPLLLVDRRTGAVGAVHAGWRGLAARAPVRAVAALAEAFGSRPDDLLAAIGPSIGPCCYEVGGEVFDQFADAGADPARWFTPARPGKWILDPWAAARGQLEEAGVAPARIFDARLCTASHPGAFCSYRRDGPPAGRLAAAIRRRSEG